MSGAKQRLRPLWPHGEDAGVARIRIVHGAEHHVGNQPAGDPPARAPAHRGGLRVKAFMFCSRLHHHTLKRPLTPADRKMARLSAALLLRGHFIGREDNERAPSSWVLCAAQLASGTGCCTPRLPIHEMQYPSRACVNSQCATLTTMKRHLRDSRITQRVEPS